MTAIRFTLNGEPRCEDRAPPSATVLDWLRGQARLTGTKEGCAEGDCGACTIAIRPRGDAPWRAVNSCLLLVPQLDGHEVLTVEGLSHEGEDLHPVQRALVESDATQCGYCTPGFAMAMFAFRESGGPADDAAIHEALAGNLCRCTGYRAIVDACRKLMAGDDVVRPSRLASLAPQDEEAASARQNRHATADVPHPGERPARAASRRTHSTPCREYLHNGQTFHAPASLADLLTLRAHYPDALLLGGGTDLGLRASKGREAFAHVIATAAVAELRTVGEMRDALVIGGAATYTEALPAIGARFPAFAALISRIGSRQIRNLGTFAGNLVTASPIGDTAPCLIALGAEATLASVRGVRTLAVEDFITGYRTTALAPDEIVAAIRIPFQLADERFAAYKLSKRFDQDISTVVGGLRLRLAGGKVAELRAAFGGMSARVARAQAFEQAMRGRAWDALSLADAEALLAQDFTPLSDHRGSAGYRLRAAAGLLRRFQIETTAHDVPARLEAL